MAYRMLGILGELSDGGGFGFGFSPRLETVTLKIPNPQLCDGQLWPA